MGAGRHLPRREHRAQHLGEPISPVSLNVTDEGATWELAVLVVTRYLGTDGRWYVRLSIRDGVGPVESKSYSHRWGAWGAQRRLKKILPALELLPA